MASSVDIRLMQSKDLAILYPISRDAYRLNFGHHWEEGGLAEYLENLRSNLPGMDPEKGMELDKLYILPDHKGLGNRPDLGF